MLGSKTRPPPFEPWGGRRFQRYVDVRSIRFPLCFFSASLSFCVGFLLVARGDVRGVRTLEPSYNGLCSATKLVIPIVNGRTPPLLSDRC